MEFSTPLGVNTPNFCTTPPASSPDNPPSIAHMGLLPNIVIGIVLMVHQPLKLPFRQTLEAYPGLTPAPSSRPPSYQYQTLENTLV